MRKEIIDETYFVKDFLKELNFDNFNFKKITNGANSKYMYLERRKEIDIKNLSKKRIDERDRIGSEYNFLYLLNKCDTIMFQNL